MIGILSLRGCGWRVYESFEKKETDNGFALHYEDITPIKHNNIVTLTVIIDNNEIKNDTEVEYKILIENNIINGQPFKHKFAKLIKK
jgi:hypothetical protein